jgi:signal transduction histidine kinase
MKILIADDDFIARKTLSSIISGEGLECVVVEEGISALRELSKPNSPTIAILDWEMPGLNGIEVIKNLRKMKKKYAYCILLTAKSDPKDVETGFDAGADDFMSKPPDITLIRQKLTVAKRIMQYEANKQASQRELEKYAAHMKNLAEDRARQLVHADRLATLGTLSAGMAHEINNPATFISGNIQTINKCWKMLLDKFDLAESSDPQVQYIREEFPKMTEGILTGVHRISKIVSSLKSFSKQEKSFHRDFFDMEEAINESFNLCQNAVKYNIDVKTSFAPDLPQGYGDQKQIEQVLVNLITNAADSMSQLDTGKLTVECFLENNMLKTCIKDNGTGIRKYIADKIFNPFYTTKGRTNGTGLGLSISRSIIEEHGGKLNYSPLPQGSKFCFTLPIE